MSDFKGIAVRALGAIFLSAAVLATQAQPADAASYTYRSNQVFSLRGAVAESRVTTDTVRHSLQIRSWVTMMSGGPQLLRACVSVFIYASQQWADVPCKYGTAGNPYGGCEGPTCIFNEFAIYAPGWYYVNVAYGWSTASGWYKGKGTVGWVYI